MNNSPYIPKVRSKQADTALSEAMVAQATCELPITLAWQRWEADVEVHTHVMIPRSVHRHLLCMAGARVRVSSMPRYKHGRSRSVRAGACAHRVHGDGCQVLFHLAGEEDEGQNNSAHSNCAAMHAIDIVPMQTACWA